MRARTISPDARRVLEVASVAGMRFDLALVAELAGEAAIDEPVSHRLVVEVEPGVAAFRHALTREAFYLDVAWGRRRALHRRLAELLEEREALGRRCVAEHWAAAREPGRARPGTASPPRVITRPCTPIATRSGASRRALELLAGGATSEERVALLERHRPYAELCGELATPSWRGRRRATRDGWMATRGRRGGAGPPARRRLRAAGRWESALAAHQRAGRGVQRAPTGDGRRGRASRGRGAPRGMGSLTPALELVAAGGRYTPRRSGRRDLVARSLGLEGSVRAKLGDLDAGVALAREGLSLALAEKPDRRRDRALPAARRRAWRTPPTSGGAAAGLRRGLRLLHRERGAGRGAGLPGLPRLHPVGDGTLGRGRGARARDHRVARQPRSASSMAARSALGHLPYGARASTGARAGCSSRGSPMRGRTTACASSSTASSASPGWTSSRAPTPRPRRATTRSCAAAARPRTSTTRRWRSARPSRSSPPTARRTQRGACAAELADMAAATTNRETLAALAHALGEVALLEGEPGHAVVEFGARTRSASRAGAALTQRAHTQIRAAAAFAAAGARQQAVERLTDAYRTARKLGAQPLAARRGATARGARRARRPAAGAPCRRDLERARPHAPRARGAALRGRRANQPRDRGRALPQQAHGRHARPQHPHEVELQLPHRGDAPRLGTRTRRLTRRHRPREITALLRMLCASRLPSVGS